MITMEITRKMPHGMGPRVSEAIRRWSHEVAPVAEEAVKAEAPVYKGGGSGNHFGGTPGHLRDSIRWEPFGAYGARIVVGAPYAKYVIEGTRPHRIEPRNASILHWIDANEDHFARSVNHPGNQPNNFPEKALAPWGPIFAARLRELIKIATEE